MLEFSIFELKLQAFEENVLVHDTCIYLQKCNHCQLAGVTVGCNTQGCIAKYQYPGLFR